MGDDSIGRYIEDFGLYFENFGLPRTAGRILAWLLICDPPHQTMDELVETLQISKSTISTSSRMLIESGFINRISLPGQRRDVYRIDNDAWIKGFERKSAEMETMHQFAKRGLALVAQAPPEQRQRVEEMIEAYTFMGREYPLLLERWKQQRQKKDSSQA